MDQDVQRSTEPTGDPWAIVRRGGRSARRPFALPASRWGDLDVFDALDLENEDRASPLPAQPEPSGECGPSLRVEVDVSAGTGTFKERARGCVCRTIRDDAACASRVH